ncbi:2-hydroxyacid dehydrogenase [Enterococcus rivorum]|uniref:Phosphoglycerate dehydrogenase n=2 Tax=Enterococcus rivorum TaxID=762845 RepID=A0A1E5KZ73_9ENTE|nr:2-hydroxyacid dehydrogenase [Enterococcus rivorum]MBP2097674.1 D-3-phosphoglycerate dehydrogenase [Enterococcus rivorum]OEH83113.1 phosphoglycerate dehydrogenase [Enterococcus rivorum]
MTKVVVVGDRLVSSETLKEAALKLNIPSPIEVVEFQWYSDLTKDQFQEKILLIEKGGPEAVNIPEGILEAIVDADYLLVHIAPVSKAMIEAATQLKLIGTCRGGIEHIATESVKSKGIPLIHVIRNAEPVADFTLGLMFTETRNIARSHQGVMAGEWRKSFPNDPYKTTLSNLKVGLVGLGYIGKLVVQRLNGLGVEVLVYDPFVDQEVIKAEGLKVDFRTIEELFSEADIISLHARVTPETTNMVNHSLISLMKPSAYLINTARAAILDKEALVEALQERRIAGAALDVIWSEPVKKDDPLLQLDNLTLTSHIAGDTIDAIPRSPYLLRDVLNAYFQTGKSDMLMRL